jgi:hypothetical protein
MHDRAIWKTAPPLWRDGLAGTIELDRPAVLRFDSDDFVERLQANLDAGARDVGSFVLRPETWKSPAVGLGGAPSASVPRLYQPAHGRFYLVAGGLVCERYGLPDKVIHANCDESVFYLIRRLEPVGNKPVDPADHATYSEYGWVPSGPAGNWVAVGDEPAVGEERLPLFPMTYLDRHRRRMLAGTVPVAVRERYEGALPPAPLGDTDDPGLVLAKPGRARLEAVVLGLQALLLLADAPALEKPLALAQYQEATFFALVDLAAFLSEHLPPVWDGVASSGLAGNLVSILNNTEFRPDSGAPSWLTALHQAHANRNAVLADLSAPPAPVTGVSVEEVVGDAGNPLTVYGSGVLGLQVAKPDPHGDPDEVVVGTVDDPFFLLVEGALTQLEAAAQAAPSPQEVAPPVEQPPPSRTAGAVYAARFVYERPRCRGSQRITISQPTEAFQLAHFYDPDAPFREHRLVLPVDTSLEGLRKFPQAVKMDISAQLRKQMDRIQAIKFADLDDGNIPAEKPLDLGMICSLSIPIITICALVLLMIIVSLLNIVFFWIPLFKICLPKGA